MKRSYTPKARNKENLAKMEEIREKLGMDNSEFSIALGYVTSGGYRASTRQGATLMQLLAAEGVEMRYGGKEEDNIFPVIYAFLTIHPSGQVDALPIGGDPETATIMGRNYILVPKK